MNTTHFSETHAQGHRFFRGALFAASDSLLSDFFRIADYSLDLGLLSLTTLNPVCRLCVTAPNLDGVTHNALDNLCSLLSDYAAPGYEFTAWIIEGRKVWGWFPREG